MPKVSMLKIAATGLQIEAVGKILVANGIVNQKAPFPFYMKQGKKVVKAILPSELLADFHSL